ncbi:MAG: FAD-dependent oxidoreductase [Cyclobacteriaceae bacterium]
MKKITVWLLVVWVVGCTQSSVNDYDIIVYGGTPSGIISAVSAARNGAKVLLVEQKSHVGGMSTSGLNTAESEHMIDNAITGFAREFYIRLGEKVPSDYSETFQLGRKLNFKKGDPLFFFESHLAENEYLEMLAESSVEIIYNRYLIQANVVDREISEIRLDDGSILSAKIFIDCTYEGDLMANSGVSYTWGREDKDVYQESYAGVRLIDDTLAGRTVDSNGKLLPYFTKYDKLEPGSGDKRVMTYNFRPTMTKVESNRVPVTLPENYNPSRYQLLGDYLQKNPETNLGELIGIYDRGNGKFEFNNRQHSSISLGIFDGNLDYPDGTYERREEIYKDYKDYTLGYLYYLGHDERVPERLRRQMLSFGFAKDEFVDNDNFPYYLYIREARRMQGDFIFTQHDILNNRVKEDAVTLGSHWIDSHHVQRIAVTDSTFTNEGRIWHTVTEPFELPYRIIIPKSSEIKNLIVPVCSSLSHVAWCSYRLESTWMQMGHVAGTAAALSVQSDKYPYELDYQTLADQLIKEGMILKIDKLGPYDDYKDGADDDS